MSTHHVYTYLRSEVDQLRTALKIAQKEIERLKAERDSAVNYDRAIQAIQTLRGTDDRS